MRGWNAGALGQALEILLHPLRETRREAAGEAEKQVRLAVVHPVELLHIVERELFERA